MPSAPEPPSTPVPPRGRPVPRGRPRGNRVFTNCDRPIAHFKHARTALAADEYRLLGVYGVGGQGKTALRRHLMERHKANAHPVQRFGALDFQVASCREPARGLLALRRSLRESGGLCCNTFDVAIAHYWERAYPGEDLSRALGDLLGDPDGVLGGLMDGAREWLDLAEELPAGVGLGVKVLHRVRRRLKERGAEAEPLMCRGLLILLAELAPERDADG